jgi:hypothetical protein
MAAMNPVLPTLTVTAIYYLWIYYQRELRSPARLTNRILRDRVTYMLWRAAEQVTQD